MLEQELMDFLAEKGFTDWVKNPTPESNEFWQKWLAENPEHREMTTLLKASILGMRRKDISKTKEEALWSAIVARKNEPVFEENKNGQKSPLRVVYRWVAAVAAVALLAIVATTGLWQNENNNAITLKTAAGESKVIDLPDGSRVTLNANSTLVYPKKWDEGVDRVVTLYGEAFFEVNERGTVKKDKFIVHTEEADVEVVGTKFNVNSYRSDTKVALESGKVVLYNKKKTRSFEMKPGDVVAIDRQVDTFRMTQMKTITHSAWKDRRLVFDNTPIRDIATIIENTYGVNVVLKDNVIADRTVTGEIQIQDKELLFKALSALYNLRFTQRGDTTILIEGTE